MSLAASETPIEVYAADRIAQLPWDRDFIPEKPAAERAPDGFWDEFTWSVAMTLPRREKALANEFQQARINYFLPYQASKALNRVWTYNPLFPCVVFFAACIADPHYSTTRDLTNTEYAVRKSRHVSSIIRTSNQNLFRRELNFLAMESARKRTIAGPLNAGDQVEVQLLNGQWLPGIVERFDDTTPKFKVFVKMHLLGQLTSCEIERNKVRLLPTAHTETAHVAHQ